MLLIYSDMFKGFWLLLFPAVELVAGKIETEETFCQVSGFFLSLSIEASDVAVALITVHTALYIFRGEQGLYPFRKIAYALAAIVPIVLASMSFISSPGYVNTGQFCYLPFNPMWKRLALSWIPRYLAFTIILFLCISIYIYVRVLMSRFGAASDDSDNTLSRMSNLDSLDPPRQTTATVPPTPTIKCHGLIPSVMSSRRNSVTMADERLRRPSIATLSLDVPTMSHPSRLHSARMARRGSVQMWSSSQFGTEMLTPTQLSRRQSESDFRFSLGTAQGSSDDVITPLEIFTQPDFLQRAPPPESITPSNAAESPGGFYTKSIDVSTIAPSRISSVPNFFSILRRPPNSGPSSDSEAVLSRDFASTPSTVKTREKIVRQLRLLFIYPLVYVAIWILPFIVQLTGYGKGAPFGMRLASIIFLCLHGFVDAIVFSLKEMPWKHGHGEGFDLQSLKFWKRPEPTPDVGPRVGRTREEMMVDSRFARKRREQEMADKELERQAEADQKTQKGPRVAPEWWDTDD
ncbi:G -coupled receptor [Fusarium albosuccineum]|uniref:G -coupled receptor n=1 Tax=Fusarium albosuccineum TaxID=1237068 RepID=A0A8H4LIP1_9HYPO|nr:G -coupled receptor [Fusarium albosuccineum]